MIRRGGSQVTPGGVMCQEGVTNTSVSRQGSARPEITSARVDIEQSGLGGSANGTSNMAVIDHAVLEPLRHCCCRQHGSKDGRAIPCDSAKSGGLAPTGWMRIIGERGCQGLGALHRPSSASSRWHDASCRVATWGLPLRKTPSREYGLAVFLERRCGVWLVGRATTYDAG